MDDDAAILIVGASRGLGLGLADAFLARGRRVIGTVRDANPQTPLHDLAERSGGRLEIERVDVAAQPELAALRERLRDRRLGVLFVNAGVMEHEPADFAKAFMQAMAVNALGAITAIRLLSDLVVADGAIAAMSSGLGSIAGNESGHSEPYRSSKAALNQSLRSFAAEQAGKPWSVTAVAPGWVRTDMGGPQAPLDVETSARGIADVLESRCGARGIAFLNYQGETIPW